MHFKDTTSLVAGKAGRGGVRAARGVRGVEAPRFRGCCPVGVEGLGGLGMKVTPRTFALRVEDESMVGRHIVPGDVVVLEHGRPPRPGEVVAALVDNESVLREYRVENGQAFLRAAHPALGRLIPARELVIQGVMVRLVRG